ncbi:MAG: endonuclease/exonuclease/phosphatase family protein [Alphaproteobacteria bacterium]|nr:MAG: endonuclease/exonuclease/phosphatase family protein [Alphaproteobacteria bacterium]
MKIVTWNVNSIRVRLHLLDDLIRKHNPDIVLLQEIKCTNNDFPYDFVDGHNYNVKVYGQKAYNGVAILSKYEIEAMFQYTDEVNEARYIEGFSNGIYVASVYVPCGNKSIEAYQYKNTFLNMIAKRWDDRDAKCVLGGDFNVALTDADINTPHKWKNSVLCSDEVRKNMYHILKSNFVDLNQKQSGKNDFTWWDYRSPREGLRIDYLLGRNVTGDTITLGEYRKMEKPSDHVPVLVNLNL